MGRGFGQAAGAVMVVALVASSSFAADVPSFTNVTSGVGLTGRIGYRCAVGDIDGDGYPDLLLHLPSDFGTGDVLNKQVVLVNRPGSDPGDPFSRTFVDFTAASGVRATRAGAPSGHQSDGVVLADVDNDGDLDAFFFVYVHQNWTLTGRNDLMLNDGAGHFTYAPDSSFHSEPVYNATDDAWLDFDNDGRIDLAISQWYWNNLPANEQLYRGLGDGRFTNVTASSGIGARPSVTYALATMDWNNDGFMDLFVPLYDYLNSALTCLHWRNNGNGTFSQVQDASGYNANCGINKGSLVASFGSMPRDYDNDGDIDFTEIFVHGGTQRGRYSGPVRNDAGVFNWDWSRVKNRAAEDTDPTHDGDHQAGWFDYDGDALADFVITESFYGTNQQIYLFKQDPDHTFRAATVGSGLEAINTMNAGVYDVIPLDFDRDGDEDLLVGFADGVTPLQLWRNEVGTQESWISITLAGGGPPEHANRAGIGARIEVTAGGVTQTREVYAGPGQHAPQAPLAQQFGLGSATVIDRIRVRWPNPARSVIERTNIPVNRFLRLREVCTVAGDPTGLLVSRGGADLVLTWDDPGVAGLAWNVYRGSVPDPAGWGPALAPWVGDADTATPGIQHRDAGAAGGSTVLFYLVSAVDDCGESAR